jgi:hypothetical protein
MHAASDPARLSSAVVDCLATSLAWLVMIVNISLLTNKHMLFTSNAHNLWFICRLSIIFLAMFRGSFADSSQDVAEGVRASACARASASA